MGFLLGIFIVAIIFIVRQFLAFKRANAQGITRAGWMRLGKYLGAIAVIVACEAVLPSTVLTGKDRPAVVEPPRPLDNIAWTDSTVTYDALAQAAPWAWNLGYITRDEMARRIKDDIARAQTNLNEIKAQIDEVEMDLWLNNKRVQKELRLTIFINGLKKAQADLAVLFPTTPANSTNHKTVAEADKFIIDHIKTATLKIQKGPKEAYDQARAAVSDYRETHDMTKDKNSPEHEALIDTRNRASSEWYNAQDASRGLDLIALLADRHAEKHDPKASLPHFRGVLPVYEKRIILPSHPAPIIGPASAWTVRRANRAIIDAITGHVRTPRYQVEAHRCAVVVSDVNGKVMPQKLCEAGVRIPVNYDLTAESCVADVCKESWIFPHLSVVYEKDSFTVYTPRPVSNTNHAPISTWVATWDGVEKPLTHSATFHWNGVTNVMGKITLRHEASSTAHNVKVWRDIRTAHNPFNAEAQARHDFAPVVIKPLEFNTVNEWAAQFMALGEDRVDEPEQAERRMPRLRKVLSERQAALSVISRNLPGRCDMPYNLFGTHLNDRSVAALKKTVNDTDKSPCDTIKAYTNLLQSLERASTPGSWLWTVLRD